MRFITTISVVSVGLAALSCTAQISGPGGDDGSDPGAAEACEEVQPGPSPLRRLSRFEYNNTVRDLFGIDTHPADAFTPEKVALGFNNQAASLTVSPLLAEQYMDAAEAISVAATADMTALLPCDPAAAGESECAHDLIVKLGERVYRRPLSADQVEELSGVFAWGLENHDFATGIQLVIQAMLQSPYFLYRVELGGEAAGEGAIRLDDWAMASRLSYMLWGTMPDEALFDAARLGELSTKEQIAAQARRMLDDPRAHAALRNFYGQWLKLADVTNAEKDPGIYPGFSPEVRDLLRRETETFVDHVVWESGGGLRELLTASYTFMNGPLADFYGIDGPTGDDFEKVSLPDSKRAGLLTEAGILAAHSMAYQSSPILRGKFVREQILCMPLPPPPNDVEIIPPDLDPNLTTRERFDAHRDNPACSGCHNLMDPIGYGFAKFDTVGRFRETENDRAIDDSGEIIASDVDGPFSGPVDLAYRLAGSDQVGQCAVTQMFRYTQGRKETAADMCTMTSLMTQFAESGQSFKELMVAITQSDAFLYRAAAGDQGATL